VETTKKDHVLGSVVFNLTYIHRCFYEVNDEGESGLIFIFDDHWLHVDKELQIFMIGDDKPETERFFFK